MKKYIYGGIFLLALLHKIIGIDWFLMVALGFFVYGFANFFARGGGCYRCKATLGAGVILVIIGFGVFSTQLYLISGLLLGLAALT